VERRAVATPLTLRCFRFSPPLRGRTIPRDDIENRAAVSENATLRGEESLLAFGNNFPVLQVLVIAVLDCNGQLFAHAVDGIRGHMIRPAGDCSKRNGDVDRILASSRLVAIDKLTSSFWVLSIM
jgi:hypothetical protein